MVSAGTVVVESVSEDSRDVLTTSSRVHASLHASRTSKKSRRLFEGRLSFSAVQHNRGCMRVRKNILSPLPLAL